MDKYLIVLKITEKTCYNYWLKNLVEHTLIKKNDFSVLNRLIIGHVVLILLSNVLVQYPFSFLGMHSTWGALTYPLIFILSDLTTRICGADIARRVVFFSMIPGLILSYLISSYFINGLNLLIYKINIMPLRIALACFVAYVTGQIIDISIFQSLRKKSNFSWWFAPMFSSATGNLIDTLIFFSVAFYNCSDPFLNIHWPEIAAIDMLFKIIISIFAFVPIYGVLLAAIQKRQFFEKPH